MEQKIEVKERLRELRRRIMGGESFATLAILYSEDPGSASKGGELGFYGRGELYPEFEAVAFKLKKGETSDIVESSLTIFLNILFIDSYSKSFAEKLYNDLEIINYGVRSFAVSSIIT